MTIPTLLKSSVKGLLSDALPLIENFAPAVATAIGGPVGFAAGYILPILANAFGTHPTDIKQLAANILSDPNAAQKLQTINTEHGDLLSGVMDSVGNLLHAEVNIKLDWQPVTAP